MFWTQVRYQRAVHLSTIDLWLDPRFAREWAFISHAHSDHIATHYHAILSEGTSRFLRPRRAQPKETSILPFREPRKVRGVEFTLFPAGHIPGSAMLLAQIDGRRLLYSGDFKLQENSAAESIEIPPCEVLIMETTFGHHRYSFPPRESVIAEMAAWCDACLADGITPILLGYSLGKSQEIIASLAGRGYRFLLHNTVYEMTRIAEEIGVNFPPFEPLGTNIPDGAVVVCPPHMRKNVAPILGPSRSAIVSGWAFDPSARYRFGTDTAFCLSDHADYEDLLEFVRRAEPSRVYTVHGYASGFAGELRRLGYHASALDEDDQLELF